MRAQFVLVTILPLLGGLAAAWPERGASEQPELLSVGETVTATLAPGDELEGTSATRDRTGRATVRGKRYRLEVPPGGVLHIDLRSYLFDAYLILRDAQG